MSKVEVDTARLPLLLHDLRLPAISRLWPDIAARSDKEGWPAARFLSVLAEMELAERIKRRMERHMAESRLPPGKTLDSFDFSVVPMISKALFMALAAGDTWLEKGSNLLLFGPPGSGKTHASAALGRSLIENGYRVLFLRTTELVRAMVSPTHSMLVRAGEDGCYRIQLTRIDKPEPFAPPGHGKVVRELCTFSVETAEETALTLAKSKDPERYCRSLVRSGNTNGLKIMLDQAIGAVAPLWLTYPHVHPAWVFHAARAAAIALGVSGV
jgi:hypothetical protein